MLRYSEKFYIVHLINNKEISLLKSKPSTLLYLLISYNFKSLKMTQYNFLVMALTL